jgi:hypothetical protein
MFWIPFSFAVYHRGHISGVFYHPNSSIELTLKTSSTVPGSRLVHVKCRIVSMS